MDALIIYMVMQVLRTLPVVFLAACSLNHTPEWRLFTDVAKESGITFRNELTISERINPYTYRNFYNGAGVAIGDVNNDGLPDIYFAGNQVGNKLYLNQGNLLFKDITETAGVACKDVWSTGVTFVDINADGLLDIYVCKSGDPEAPHRNNELFINKGDLTFTEKSREYGLDVTGLSVQASFFDFDKDGDLDCYLLTNSIKSVGNFDLVKDQRNIPDPQHGGNKFFINEKGKFRDYSEAAGIYRSNIGFGLGITLGDFNDDSWTDIFVSNDFFERDYLYINNQKGSFTESLTDYFQSISMGSMGADFADLDNDGCPELFVTEMLPDSLNRKKTKTIFESWNKYQMNLQNGYYNQFSRNVLQKKTGRNTYAEVGRLAGIAASEWSWGALLFDMNNDGRRDIFIANGIYKDLLDRDYLTYSGAEENVRKIIREEKNPIVKLIGLMPTSSFSNYAFRNDGNLNFRNVAAEWGLANPAYSSGSAYADLDNDGDVDLVVSNMNAPASIYRNNSDSSRFKSIDISLSSEGKNTFAVGAQVTAFCGSAMYFADNFVTRGYQSSVQPRVHIGLGEDVRRIDSLLIQWPDRGDTMLYAIPVNHQLRIAKKTGRNNNNRHRQNHPYASEHVQLNLVSNTLFKHGGSGLVDFDRERLLPMMYSSETPPLLKGDIDKDGVEDFYVGGGKGQPAKFIQFKSGKWEACVPGAMNKYSLSEETKGALFDVDNDGDLDLYMATGGRFFPTSSTALLDIIFINNGKGVFAESPFALPFANLFSTSVTTPIDFDNDGDNDLLVGDRGEPFYYGLGGRGYLLENNGKGLFTDVTLQYAPDLMNRGMITDAVAADYNNDGWKDIVLVGDWMPITVLKNEKGHFTNSSTELRLNETEGWWHAIRAADFNKDGKIDFVVGNHGLNTFFKSGDRMYLNDFDRNGSVEQLFCTKVNGKYYPIVDKDELLSQLPSLKKSLLHYDEYSKKSIEDLFPGSILDKSKVFEVKLLSSVLLLSGSNGYDRIELPLEAQYSSIYSFLVLDFDHDGVLDILAGGNQFQVKPQFGRQDGSSGWMFKGRLKDGRFSFEPGVDLGVKGQIRGIDYTDVNGVRYILFAKYDDELEIYKTHH